MIRNETTIIQLLESLASGRDLQLTQNKLCEYSSSTGYGMALLSIFCNKNGNGTINDLIRHQSGILLKNFLSENWENNRINEKEKNSIKSNLLNETLFGDKNSAIRKTTAMMISVLAEFDFPEKWCDLLDIILSFIHKSCDNKNILLLSGSIDCLAYFVEDICDLQITNIAPVLFPLLFEIINSVNDCNIRYNALCVYRSLLNIALEMRIISMDITRSLVDGTIINYLQFIHSILSDKNVQNIRVQTLCIDILNDITAYYSSSIVRFLPMILSSMWTLMQFYGDHVEIDIAHYSFYNNAFAWIISILKHKRRDCASLLDDKLNDICVLCIKLVDLSQNDLDLFMYNPNEFILNEENHHIYNENIYNLRGLIGDALRNMLEIRPRTGYCALLQSAKRRLSSSQSVFERESVLFVFGILAQYHNGHHKMEHFLQEILWSDLHNNDNALLRFRALWTLNKFVFSLNIDAKKQIMPQIFESMKNVHPLCIRYEAIKCLESIVLCNDCPLFYAIGGDVMRLLCDLLIKMDDSTLKYVLKSLCCISKHNKGECAQYEAQIMPLIISLWSQYCLNQDIMYYIKRIISIYVGITANNVIKRIIPSIAKILSTTNCDVSVTNCCLQIMYILMKEKESAQYMIFYTEFLPQILDLVYCSTDSQQMNIAAKILCLMINNNAEFVIKKGMTPSLCRIISKYLSPQIPESASNGIGPLINQLVIHLKCTLSDAMLSSLLLTIINRINTCYSASLRNQLLLVFPRLIHEYGPQRIIHFLLENKELSNILTMWCSNHNDFIFPFYKKMSVTALAKILQSDDHRSALNNISFDGYPIININAPRSSRSRSRQQLQYTQMPFYAKLFHIVVNTFRDLVDADNTDDDETDDEYYNSEEDEEEDEGEGEDHDEDEEDDEYNPEEEDEDDEDEDEEEEQENVEEELKALLPQQQRSLLNQKPSNIHSTSTKRNNEEFELELCPEALNDKIFHLEFEKWAKQFVAAVSNQYPDALQNVTSMLNENDQLILSKILN